MGKIFDALDKFETERSLRRLETKGNVHQDSGGPTSEKTPILESLKGRQKMTSAPSPPSRRIPFGHPDKNLITYYDPSGYESEQFKMLRTTLLFPASGKPARTIMVTSALPGEGKSFVASNLAVSMAYNINDHVLLIDADIRKPTIHTIFGFGEVPGLSEHLSETQPLSSLILKTAVDKLSLLPSGKPPHNPSELLSSDAMSDLIEETKNRYNDRYIIIDSPPPSLTSETAAMARRVDGVVIVINSESTPKDLVEKLTELIGKEKILGIVMNRFDKRGSKYYRYGKYGVYGNKK